MSYENEQPLDQVHADTSLQIEAGLSLFASAYDYPTVAVTAESLGGRVCELLNDLAQPLYEKMNPAARETIREAILANPNNVEINSVGHVVLRDRNSTRVFMPNGDNVTFGANGAIQKTSGRFVVENIGAIGTRISHLPEQRGARGGGIDWFPAKPHQSQSWSGTSRSGLFQPARPANPGTI